MQLARGYLLRASQSPVRRLRCLAPMLCPRARRPRIFNPRRRCPRVTQPRAKNSDGTADHEPRIHIHLPVKDPVCLVSLVLPSDPR